MAIADIDVRALVEQHKRGDAEAFDEIVRRHAPRLLAHARMRLGDPIAAEDAVQETFLRAYRAMPRFEGDFHLQAWLHRICTNVCFDELDRRRRQGDVHERLVAQPFDQDEHDLDADRQSAAMAARLSDALGQIPGQYREALVMHYGEDLSFREIARRTGVSEENARARASRGRRALRKLMAAPMAGLAFLIPALRRGERAAQAAELGTTGATPDPSAMSSATSLLHQVAPTLTRVAADVGPAMTNKAQLITGAVAAATTVAVPVAATQVIDRTERPSTPVAAEAPTGAEAPAPLASPPSTIVVIASTAAPTPAQSASTAPVTTAVVEVTAPPSSMAGGGVDPTPSTTPGGDDDGAAAQLEPSTTVAAQAEVTTTAPPSTEAPVVTVPVVVAGPASVSAALSASQSGTRWSLSGTVSISPDSAGGLSVAMSGVAEVTEGATDADPDRLRLSLTGGSISITVQARGTYDAASGTFSITQGQHSTKSPGGSGISTSGGASGSLALAGGSVSLRLS